MIIERWRKWWYLAVSLMKIKQGLPDASSSTVALLDTSINTDNRGDDIIMYYCRKALDEIFQNQNYVRVSTHSCPKEQELEQMKKCCDKIICGTNILSCALEHTSLWKMPDRKEAYAGCTVMGAGWGFYSEKTSWYTRIFYRNILSRKRLHSVRDRYTLEKLQELGVKNVVYTGCPTMWGLTPDHCAEIPCEKSRNAVFTVTSYAPDETDKTMIEILCRNYDTVYAWPQGRNDKEYIQKLVSEEKNVILLGESLEAYAELLQQEALDYVGTRLHGGVMALNFKKRSVIIAVDNRAAEIGRDTGLPLLYRSEIADRLEDKLRSSWDTRITMPLHNIKLWKEQFVQERENTIL